MRLTAPTSAPLPLGLVCLSWFYFQGLPLWMSDGHDLDPAYAEQAIAALFWTCLGLLAGASVELTEHARPFLGARASALAVVVLSPFLTLLALESSQLNLSFGYGQIEALTSVQIVLGYVALMLLPWLLWSYVRTRNALFIVAIAALVAPRLIVSLYGQRFYVMQALIPIAIVWRLAGFVSGKMIAAMALSGALIVSLALPALRGDETSGIEHIATGSPIGLVKLIDSTGVLEIASKPALFACQLAASISDVCALRDKWGIPDDVSARYDQVLSAHVRTITGIAAIGTGGNPIPEIFTLGGFDPFAALVFLVIGALTGLVVANALRTQLCCFLLPHVSAKALFLWRATSVEFFDRLAPLLAIYALYALASAAYSHWATGGPTR